MSVESSEIRTTRHTMRADAVGRLVELLDEHNRRVAKLARRYSVTVVPAKCRIISTSIRVEHPAGSMVEVEVTAQTARIAGFEIVASVTRTDEGYMLSPVGSKTLGSKTLRGGMAGIDAEAVVARGGDCDHCRTRRKRAATYLLRDGEGKVQQVGSTCLADYAGSRSGRSSLAPSAWAAYADMLVALDRSVDEVGREEETLAGSGSARKPSALPLVHYLSFVRAAIRLGGWVSRGKAHGSDEVATADAAWDAMTDNEPWMALRPSEEDHRLAAEDLDIVAESLPLKLELSDYEQNLLVVINQGFAFRRNIGLAASVCAVADRIREALAREVEQSASLNEHFGTVDERGVFELRCYQVQDVDSRFGVSHLHLFADAKGRRAKWFSSRAILEPGVYENRRQGEEARGV